MLPRWDDGCLDLAARSVPCFLDAPPAHEKLLISRAACNAGKLGWGRGTLSCGNLAAALCKRKRVLSLNLGCLWQDLICRRQARLDKVWPALTCSSF